jgi:predicted phosphodiesterase
LVAEAVGVAGSCDRLAAQLGHIPATVARELAGLPVDDAPLAAVHGHGLWVREHLEHLKRNLAELEAAAAVVAQSRAVPWWR